MEALPFFSCIVACGMRMPAVSPEVALVGSGRTGLRMLDGLRDGPVGDLRWFELIFF